MFSILRVAIFISNFTLPCGKNVVINCFLISFFYGYGKLGCHM